MNPTLDQLLTQYNEAMREGIVPQNMPIPDVVHPRGIEEKQAKQPKRSNPTSQKKEIVKRPSVDHVQEREWSWTGTPYDDQVYSTIVRALSLPLGEAVGREDVVKKIGAKVIQKVGTDQRAIKLYVTGLLKKLPKHGDYLLTMYNFLQ